MTLMNVIAEKTNMKKEIKICECCGQKIREYQVTISPMMIKTLVKFRMAVMDKGQNEVHLLKDMDGKSYELTKHEWNNFSRLRFHALVAKVKDESGYWLMTKRGADFLNGKIDLPKAVWVRDNRVIDHNEDVYVNIKDVVGTAPYLEKLEDIVYRSFEPKQTSLM